MSKLVQMARTIVLRLLKDGFQEPEIFPVEDGIDLNWESKRVYCTLRPDEFTITQRKGEKPSNDIQIEDFPLEFKDYEEKLKFICLKIQETLLE